MSSHALFIPNPKLKLVDQCREVLRFFHYSYRTEQTYVEWIQRYVRFCRQETGNWRHPRECGETELKAFLSHLASDRSVGASTQNQALNALVFLYGRVLGIELGDFSDFARAKRPTRLPAVLTRDECSQLFSKMEVPMKWIAQLLYGSGLRLMECLRLRVKDVDFGRGLITVRSGKGDKDRVTMVPDNLKDPLRSPLDLLAADGRWQMANGRMEALLIANLAVTCQAATAQGREPLEIFSIPNFKWS